MRLRNAALGTLAVLAAGGGAALLAEEQVEHVLSPETGALRPPEGDWIAPVPGRSAELWAVGDADAPASRRVARLLRRANPDRILYLGDVYPRGRPQDFERWAEPFGTLVRLMAPTPGNHEWPEAREGYEPFWEEVTGETPPTYYGFDAGGWRVLSANSEHSERRAVESWIEHETSGPGDCRIVFMHRPRYSAGGHGDQEDLHEYWEALRDGSRIVLAGHDHNMQRLQPIDGVVQFVAGAVGRKHYELDEADARLAFFDEAHVGALRLRLSPGRAGWAFVAAGGQVLDSGSLRCSET